MPIDLVDLRRRCDAATQGNTEAADQVFNRIVAENAATDLCCYGLWVHGKHPTLRSLAQSRHVHLWATLLAQYPQLLLVCPPEHGKSTVMRWHLEQWIGQRTEAVYAKPDVELAPSALLVMNTATQAEKQCMAIAATLESNHRYARLFPHVRKAEKFGWTKDTLFCHRPADGTMQPDPTLQAMGMNGPVQGARIGLVVVDDPTDQADAKSDSVMQKQKEWHQGVLNDRLLDGGLQRDICTRWSKTDIAQMLMDSETWHSAVLPALGQLPRGQQPPIWPESYPEYPWGNELWPDLWPAERLERKRKEKLLVEDSLLWQLAYMCNPTEVGGNLFKRNWFQYAPPPAEFEGALQTA